MRPTCSVEGCETTINARALCYKHYQRFMKYGSPLGGSRNHAPPEERFWRFVEQGQPHECWIWNGHTGGEYGLFQPGGKGSPHIGAHRFAYSMAHGVMPEVVLHTCDTPRCVNPAHLRGGTYADNTADMIAKGRRGNPRALGDKNYNTKLSPDDVRAIRQRKGESAGSVGRDFGVNHKAILAIWRGITWTHID